MTTAPALLLIALNTTSMGTGAAAYPAISLPGVGRTRGLFSLGRELGGGVLLLVAAERAESASWAVEQAISQFAEVGIRIERMLTDNGSSYRSHAYRDTLADRGIRHKRTRPFRPQTNGKAERFIQTLLNEWAYARPYRSNGERLRALRRFVHFYNRGRPHTAIGGLVPQAAVNNVLGHHS